MNAITIEAPKAAPPKKAFHVLPFGYSRVPMTTTPAAYARMGVAQIETTTAAALNRSAARDTLPTNASSSM